MRTREEIENVIERSTCCTELRVRLDALRQRLNEFDQPDERRDSIEMEFAEAQKELRLHELKADKLRRHLTCSWKVYRSGPN